MGGWGLEWCMVGDWDRLERSELYMVGWGGVGVVSGWVVGWVGGYGVVYGWVAVWVGGGGVVYNTMAGRVGGCGAVYDWSVG